MAGPTNFSIEESLDTVWEALHGYREDCIPETDAMYDEQWDDICTAMAWIKEALPTDPGPIPQQTALDLN